MLLVLSMLSITYIANVNAAKTAGYDKMSKNCQEKLFPVSSGGSKDEKVSCTMNFPKRELILMAGNTTSEDYAPAASDHAYLYAIDYEGNWQWGKFFYNVSFAVATISGCDVDANDNAIMIGMGNSVPIIMEVNPVNGAVINFLSLDKIGSTATLMPWYATYGAIYHDTKDETDGKSYYYSSFIMEDAMMITKINSKSLEVKYSYQYKIEEAGFEWKNKKIPGFLIQDKEDNNKLILFGQFNQRASAIKFSKRDVNVDWKLEIKSADSSKAAPISEMNEIYSYAIADDDKQWIYGCGYKWVDPTQETFRNAVTMKMSNKGQVQFLDVWAGAMVDQRDTCRAVTYDEGKREVVFMLEVTSNVLRPNYDSVYKYSADRADAHIVTMRPGGQYLQGYNLNYYTASISMYVGGHSMFVQDDYIFFGSYSWGFKTKVQNVTYDIVTPTYDSHLIRFDPSSKVQCFYKDETDGSSLTALTTRYTDSQIVERNNDRYLFKKLSNLYFAYSSKYSGSFDLSDTLKYPKMCMDYSINMTKGIEYYRGQNEKSYIIGKESVGASAANEMDEDSTWLF